MEQTTMKDKAMDKIFKRKAKIGLSLLDLKKGEPVFVEIKKFEMFDTKKYGPIPMWTLVELNKPQDLRHLFLDGGLKGTFSKMGGLENQVDKSFEICFTGKTDFTNEETGEIMNVNTYDVYELEF